MSTALAIPEAKSLARLKDCDAAAAAVARHVLDHQTVNLGGKRYVTVAGATRVAAACGFYVREIPGASRYVEPTDWQPGYWECTVEVVDEEGRVRGVGTGMVADDEPHWAKRPAFARRAMASTRAAGRALRLSVGHLYAGLGDGVQTATYEEMPDDAPTPQKPAQEAPRPSGEFVDPDPDASKGRLEARVVRVEPPREGKKGQAVILQTANGLVRLGAFEAHLIDNALELVGSSVAVQWKRSKDGKWLNLVDLLHIQELPF